MNTIKRILAFALAALLFAGCAETAVKDGGALTDKSPTVTADLPFSEDILPADPEPESVADVSKPDDIPANEDVETYWWTDIDSRPDGKEVTIFADNTTDCDYSGYKKISYDFQELTRSVMVPEDWYGYRFYWDDPVIENYLTGIPIYDGPVPAEIDYNDKSSLFEPDPMDKSVFFFAESPWTYPQDYIAEHIEKFDHETYTDKKGRTIQIYFLDNLPKYAVFDDYFFLCVWFNLKDEEQIPTVVNMINSIEVTLSKSGLETLSTAEKLGYQLAESDGSEVDFSEDGSYLPDPDELRARPDGKEVTIFADNTSDCDYSGYKEIGYDFGNLRRSLMIPDDWNGFRFDGDGSEYDGILTGIPIYDGNLPVKIDMFDKSTRFANKPMEKSVFFFAETPSENAQDLIYAGGLISKYDHETYVDKKGRTVQIYYLDGLPKLACYDDYFGLCVWFNLKGEEQIPTAVNMLNSIDVTLSSNALFVLHKAEKLGYSVISPEGEESGQEG